MDGSVCATFCFSANTSDLRYIGLICQNTFTNNETKDSVSVIYYPSKGTLYSLQCIHTQVPVMEQLIYIHPISPVTFHLSNKLFLRIIIEFLR